MKNFEDRALVRPDHVYFIATKDKSLVKIGVSRDPYRRLKTLQTGNPVELEMLHIELGSYRREKELHEMFANLRTNGEWFEFRGRLKAFAEVEKFFAPEYAYPCDRARSIREAMWDMLEDEELDAILLDPSLATEYYYKGCKEKAPTIW